MKPSFSASCEAVPYPEPFMRPDLVRPWIQETLDALGFARNDLEIGLRWLVRYRAALLPVTESAQRNVVADGKFLLRQG